VALYVLTIYVLATIVFVLPRALPGDPLQVYVDDTVQLDPALREDLRRFHGLDGSLPDQYGRYLARLARGDLGDSIAGSQPVTRLIRENLPWTLLLVGTALLLSSVMSFRAGVAAAWRRGSFFDKRLQVVTTVLRAFPEYAVATFLLLSFGVVWQVLPISGSSTPFTTDRSLTYKIADVAGHLVLPLTALTLGLIGNKFLMVRNLTIGVLGQDYMLLARAKGLPERLQRRHHAGRNALLPYLNFVGVQVGVAVGGSVFVETVFGYKGMGQLLVNAVNSRDYQVIESVFLLLAVVVLTVNLLVDLAGTYVDPRVRAE
jgi:peptide/nickel transport system permease protein